MDSMRLKSTARIISPESYRTLATHVLAIICSHFQIGHFDMPSNLSQGAKDAILKLAKHIFNCDVRPIDARFQISYDEHGFRFNPDKGDYWSNSFGGQSFEEEYR